LTPERRGHGRTPDVEGPISFELMAKDTIAFLEIVVGGPAHPVGCSDGAIVALLVALRRPDLVRRLVFIAGVFHLDGWSPGVLDGSPPVMIGDDDEITFEHAVALYRGLPDGELAVIPGTSHGLLVEKPSLCNTIILDFLTNEPVPTMAPIRRA
jgi:pimeloyl-ACP methyl ester carboxylesterase